jgi:N-methylhydantoinase A
MHLIGVDVGGTFTDIVSFDLATRHYRFAKVPSIRGEQWRGVVSALEGLGVAGTSVQRVAHGTTIATNALLELNGAKTALVTTQGFRDIIEIGRTRRMIGGLFDMFFRRPPPLVPRDRRFEVDERIDARGQILRAVDSARVREIVGLLHAQAVEAVAICFINAHENPIHERALADALSAQLPGVAIVTSTEIVRERGEFERTSTCVLNAYLMPTMQQYLGCLGKALVASGVSVPLSIMGSNGGAMTLEQASRYVVGTFLSGPVGGAIASIALGRELGVDDFITFDMGGTSTDVLLVHESQPRLSFDNQVYAYPLRAAQLHIHTIGAGGGSIIGVRADATVDVGPDSAGAVPGPACYQRGGTRPTISDANLLVGRLPAEHEIAGSLRLSVAAASKSFTDLVASEPSLGAVDPVAIASAAIDLAVAKMAGAVREVSVHRGYDQRDFALLAFGGAGPLHAFLVADELGMRHVVIPPYPGHFSALGQMCADFRRDFATPWKGAIDTAALTLMRAAATRLVEQGHDYLEGEAIASGDRSFMFALDVRYAGQSFTLPIAWTPDGDSADDIITRFHARHCETFGYASLESGVEATNLRLVAVGRTEKPPLDFSQSYDGSKAGDREGRPRVRRPVFDGTAWIECMVIDRTTCAAGTTIDGPAIIEESGATSYLPAGWVASIHGSKALICERRKVAGDARVASAFESVAP